MVELVRNTLYDDNIMNKTCSHVMNIIGLKVFNHCY